MSDAVNAATKAATGAASVGAASASGALGVVTGSIDVLKGGYMIGTALSDKSKLDAAKANIDKTLNELEQAKSDAAEQRDKDVTSLRLQMKNDEADARQHLQIVLRAPPHLAAPAE